ncbi:endoglucanase [Fibrobacteres bacterium R8-0-B4]
MATGTLTSKNATASGQIKIRASNNAQIVSGGATRYTMQSAAVSGTVYEGKINVSAPGRYRVKVGSELSAPFWISEDVYGWVRDAAVKFPAVNRCGDTESWFHGACHLKDATLGGWHDCGDHLKEGITQSFLHSMVGLASAALRDRDVDHYGRNHNSTVLTDGVPDVLYEARHGSQYVINAYNNARGGVSKMILSVGGFGPDHQWWGQPEMQDRMSYERGGPVRDARNEVGANILGNFAAGLALTAKNYSTFDKKFADTSIAIAKKLYEYGKAHPTATETPAYSGNGKAGEKLAFAALALAYVTGERKYLTEFCYDPSLGGQGGTQNRGDPSTSHALYEGGLVTSSDRVFSKMKANTDWASPQMAVKWGFFRLILKDKAMCRTLGIDSTERLKLIEKTLYQMTIDLRYVSGDNGQAALDIPGPGFAWGWSDAVRYDGVWNVMHTQQDWMWNRYQFGNIFDLYCYSDMAKWVQDSLISRGIFLPGRSPSWPGEGLPPPVSDWKAKEARELMVRQMDYMLGVNPWDISMIYGIGAKNTNHPHHRAANPEGKNVPGDFYRYRPPVGALSGAISPITGRDGGAVGVYSEHYDDYYVTETGIDASAVMLIPIMGLAKEEPIDGPPDATVRVVYVGSDQAIIEVRQSRYGMSTIRYAADGVTAFTSVQADSAGMFHRIVLTNLKPGTTYNFDALVSDLYGNSNVIKNDRDEYFTFTTLASPPGKAEITNVKVCNVTSDSAGIFRSTPNGSYDSRVVYGDKKPPTTIHDGNIYGRPSQFHYVKIGGLKEKTTYYFYVENNGTRDDNKGQYYTFTTPVEHVEFDIRVLKYSDQFFGLNVVNQDIKDYDSLELRIYVRMPDTLTIPPSGDRTNGRVAFSDYIGFRVDIGIKYRSDGYQDTHFQTDVDKFVQAARPIRIEDTYDPRDSTWGFYIPVPMGGAKMESGARFRLDLMIDTRSTWSPYKDLMNVSPSPAILNRLWKNAWSFVKHSRPSDPADYPGVPTGSKDDVDNIYFSTPVNQYITVYRKNEFVWGYSPSAKEQQTKKTHYEMTSQITSPLYNPSEEYLFIEQVMPQITVSGWAKINENGAINEIWVNGNKLRDVNSVARYDFATDKWNFVIPVPVRNGGNNIDITIFGGPENECATCYGCAFSNHSFYLEFRGADPYPSTMKLLSCANQSTVITDTAAHIDTTCFRVSVDDKNGNLNKDKRDTVWVSVVNPVIGDSIYIPLVETGDTTGIFISVSAVRVVSAPPSSRGSNEISMDGGQTVTVTYVDITDPTDVSQVRLTSRADFAVPVSAYFTDTAGTGSINAVYIKYSKIPNRLPDSLRLAIPGISDVRTVKAPGDNISAAANDGSTIRFALSPPVENVTGFKANEQMTARSFLVYNGAVKEAVIPARDSAGPALLHRATLFERSGGGADTIEVTLSEPMTGASLVGGTLFLRHNGKDFPLTVSAAIDSSLLTNSLTLLAVPAVGGRVADGDSIFIDPKGPAADRGGNKAHDPNRPVPVILRSATPRIISAAYYDTSADGIIDKAELRFSKALDLAGLRLWLSWGDGPFVLVDWSNLSGDTSEAATTWAAADIGGLLTNSVATGGVMRAMATHNKFPGDTIRANVADKAAPVVTRAQLSPGGTENSKDSLTVTFSEPLSVSSTSPFILRYCPDSAGRSTKLTLYSLTLQNNAPNKVSSSHTFIVNAVNTLSSADGAAVTAPTKDDSLWIDASEMNIYDTSVNIQRNENNRRVKLSIKPAPITIKIIPAPNPYRPAVKYSGDQPAKIIVRPSAKALGEMNLNGTISIYDKQGDLVLKDTLTPQRDTPDLVYRWDGHTEKGRKAGTGTYLIMVSVEQSGEEGAEKAKAVTGKALIFILR